MVWTASARYKLLFISHCYPCPCAGVMGVEATGLGFVCFVINPRCCQAFFFVLFYKLPNSIPPPPLSSQSKTVDFFFVCFFTLPQSCFLGFLFLFHRCSYFTPPLQVQKFDATSPNQKILFQTAFSSAPSVSLRPLELLRDGVNGFSHILQSMSKRLRAAFCVSKYLNIKASLRFGKNR